MDGNLEIVKLNIKKPIWIEVRIAIQVYRDCSPHSNSL